MHAYVYVFLFFEVTIKPIAFPPYLMVHQGHGLFGQKIHKNYGM